MSLKCAACHRPLKKAAKQHGKAVYGPVCAARYFGNVLGGVRQAPERDDKTVDMFEEKKGEK